MDMEGQPMALRETELLGRVVEQDGRNLGNKMTTGSRAVPAAWVTHLKIYKTNRFLILQVTIVLFCFLVLFLPQQPSHQSPN